MLVLNNVSSGYSTNVINNNFVAIANYINQSLLNRDGLVLGEPNQMEVDLDMNSQDILNVGSMGAKEIVLDSIPIKGLLDDTVERATQEADRAEREADRAEAATIAHDAYLLNRANHTGVQPISTITGLQLALDNKVNVVAGKQLSTEDFTTPLKNKLDGIAAGATANQTDAYLLDRANHTGTQAAATITGLSDVATSNDYNDLDNLPALGTAASTDSSDYATAAQGELADSAVQPSDLAEVATSGEAGDVSIVDTGSYYTSSSVEGALQEIGLMLGDVGSALDAINGEVV